MAVSVENFRAQYPEFKTAAYGQVAAELARAATRCPEGVWGTRRDHAIGLMTAQALALSPYGRGMKLVEKDGSTVYDSRLKALQREVAPAGFVI